MTTLVLVAAAASSVLIVPPGTPAAQPGGASAAIVELAVSPLARRLQARAKLKLRPGGPGPLRFGLHPDLAVLRVTLDDRPLSFTREGQRLEAVLPRLSRPAVLGVDYAGRPTLMAGDLKAQDVGPDGLVLHPDGAWLPRPVGKPGFPVAVALRAPTSWRAVGRPNVRVEYGSNAPLAFVAGPYRSFTAAGTTFFALPRRGVPSDPAPAEAVARLLRARGLGIGDGLVAELPPGYAPLATRAFVAAQRPAGDVGEWLATQAWSPITPGLAVRPERAWLVESLAAYCADMAGGAAAREQARREHLSAYREFLRGRPGQDRPLLQAAGAAEPVVRDKGALVWAMLHEALGDEGFWAMLRRYQAALREGGGDWGDFEAALGRRAEWLASWLRQPGLPGLRVDEVRSVRIEDQWHVTGVLTQPDGFFGLPLDLSLVTEAGVERVGFTVFAPRVPFHFTTTSRPLRLVLDGADRAPVRKRPHLLIGEGVAPADGVIVYGTHGDAADVKAAREAAEALRERLKHFKGLELPLRADHELSAAERARSLLLFGRPGVNAIATELADQFPVRFIRGEAPEGGEAAPVDGKALWWQGRAYTQPDNGVVQAIANPLAPERTVLLFAGLSSRAQLDALRYTQRPATFCVFAGERVVAEGTALRAFPDLDVVLY